MAWTEEMVEGLRQMWLEGLTANEIAKRLGVTKNSIVGKVHRLCLKARPSPIKKKDEEKEEVVEKVVAQQVEEEDVVEADVVAAVEMKRATEEKSCGGENIKLVQLDSHTCRWPLGDPRDDDFCFCGRKVKTGQTYCDEHSMMAYVRATKK